MGSGMGAGTGPGIGAQRPEDPRAVASERLRKRLDQGLVELGGQAADLSDNQRRRLIDYVELLTHWNSRFNLSGIRDPLEMVGRHLLDSLAGAAAFTEAPVLDLGTGAGLPGIPLAIAHPELEFVLLDSVGKKTRFVRQTAAQLALTNVTVVQTRLESYRPSEKFATITARALAPLDVLWSESAHLRRPETVLIAYKGRRPDDEIDALSAARLQVRVERLKIPFVPGERHLIRVRHASQDASQHDSRHPPENHGQNHRDC